MAEYMHHKFTMEMRFFFFFFFSRRQDHISAGMNQACQKHQQRPVFLLHGFTFYTKMTSKSNTLKPKQYFLFVHSAYFSVYIDLTLL